MAGHGLVAVDRLRHLVTRLRRQTAVPIVSVPASMRLAAGLPVMNGIRTAAVLRPGVDTEIAVLPALRPIRIAVEAHRVEVLPVAALPAAAVTRVPQVRPVHRAQVQVLRVRVMTDRRDLTLVTAAAPAPLHLEGVIIRR